MTFKISSNEIIWNKMNEAHDFHSINESNRNQYHANVDEYQTPNMQWYNALAKIHLPKKLISLNLKFYLKII